MGVINVFNSISHEKKIIEGNGKLKYLVSGIDFKHSIMLKAGNRIDENYEVTPEDVLYVRLIPGSTAVMATIAIVTAVVAVGVGVGTAIYANKLSDEAKEKMEKAQRDAENLAAKVGQLPFIRGAKNQSALGKSIQFVMGNVYNTPYNISNGFYSIDGENGVNSYYNAVFSLGYNKQKITQVLLGEDKTITDENGITEGIHDFDETSLYYDPNLSNCFELANPGTELTLPNCSQKVSSTYIGGELKHEFGEDAEPIILQCAENAMKVQVCIQFNSLRAYNSDSGVWTKRKATVKPYWSNDNGETWNEFYFSGMTNNEIELNVNHSVRFVATKLFTAEESFGKSISIKVEKVTPKAENNTQEDCVVLWHQTFCYDAKTSDDTELLPCYSLLPGEADKQMRCAYRIQSSTSTNEIIDEIHCMAESYARVWNGQSWSNTKVPTRNPAAWILEILTCDFHTPSLYSDDEIDLASLGVLYEYCEEEEFYTDGIIVTEEKKLDIITKILSTVNADMIKLNGKLTFAIDKEEVNPVCLLNVENIVSFNYAKDLNRKTSGSKVIFTNRENWQIDTFYSMLDGGEYDPETDVVDEISTEYVTTYEHAYKMAQRKKRERQLMPMTVEAVIGPEGGYYPLFSLVKVQLPQLRQGIRSSVITGLSYNNNKIVAINISDLVTFEENKNYGVIIQATNNSGHRLINCRVTGNGSTRQLQLIDKIDLDSVVPELGNHLSFGLIENNNFEKVATVMKIYGIEDDNNGYKLTLRNYDSEVYSYGESIPEYKTNITQKQKNDSNLSLDDYLKLKNDMQNSIINSYGQAINGSSENIPEDISLFEAWAEEDRIKFNIVAAAGNLNAGSYKIICQINKGDSWSDVVLTKDNEYIFNRSTDGYPEASTISTWKFRAKSENIYGFRSENWVETNISTTNYGTWEVGQPLINVRVSDRTLTLILSQPSRSDGKTVYGNVKYKVQIKKPSVDTQWFKPAQSLDPYINENNYKDGTGFVISDGLYIQTMPLDGQATDKIVDTLYQFKVAAYNEKGVDSTESVINATALCTSIQDIVKANETAKDSYIGNLTALCSAFGFISSGIIDGIITNKKNYWTLNNGVVEENDENNIKYQGAFRVGGENQFILVKPVNIVGGVPQDYEVVFKVGNFEITTQSSNINGQLIVRTNEKSMDQTLITPTGTYFQHRNSLSSPYYTVAQLDTSGVVVPVVRNDGHLIIGNMEQSTSRRIGHDIGRKYFTDNAKVYHFDDDYYSQRGTDDGLTIDGDQYELKNGEDNEKYTPAILAVAPYCQNAKAIWGYFNLLNSITNVLYSTVDFWIQYFYAENQILFNVGSNADKVKLSVLPQEPDAVVSGSSTWLDNNGNYIYTNCRNPDMFNEGTPENPNVSRYAYINKTDADNYEEGDYIIEAVTYNEDYTVATITVEGTVYQFMYGYSDYNYEIFEQDNDEKVLAVQRNSKKTLLQHIGLTQQEDIEIDTEVMPFNQEEWYHIGVTADDTKLYVFIGSDSHTYAKVFDRYSSQIADVEISINENKTQLIVDELYIDGSATDYNATETEEDFNSQTERKVPWGALDENQDYMIFDSNNPANVKSNIIDYFINQFLNSAEFRNKVLEITGE